MLSKEGLVKSEVVGFAMEVVVGPELDFGV